ncbi:MAG: DUF4397 domain-containing protein [Peptostreptococcaceae bacterium]
MRNWDKNYSLIRMLNAIPDGEEVDIYINGTPFYKGLDFPDFSPYVYVPQGEYTITVYLEDTKDNPIISEKITINAGELVTIAITGEGTDLKLLPITEEAEIVSGKDSKVRLVHLSPNYPDINIIADNQELFKNVKYRDITEYVSIPAKVYYVIIEEAVTGKSIRENQVKINEGRVYTFYIVGNIPNVEIIQSLDGVTFMK